MKKVNYSEDVLNDNRYEELIDLANDAILCEDESEKDDMIAELVSASIGILCNEHLVKKTCNKQNIDLEGSLDEMRMECEYVAAHQLCNFGHDKNGNKITMAEHFEKLAKEKGVA